jgi:hypothetical protein
MTSVASLALAVMAPAMARAEIVTVQGDNGEAGANGVDPGDPGMPGVDGESVAANAGSVHPITAPINISTATGGNGGLGGNGVDSGNGGNGGNGGAAVATAATTLISGSAGAGANSYGGGSVGYPVRLLIKRQGDMTLENLLRRLRCKRCRATKPAPGYLVAGHHRTARGGPDADWSLELVPPPEVKPILLASDD